VECNQPASPGSCGGYVGQRGRHSQRKSEHTKSFTVTPSPVITGLSPTSGPVGATVTVTGSNFTAGGTQTPQVVFNPGLFVSPISSTDTSDYGRGSSRCFDGRSPCLGVATGTATADLFTVTSSGPSISSLTPGAGMVGTAVTITGANSVRRRGQARSHLMGHAGIPTSWSATSINVPVPTGATTGKRAGDGWRRGK